MKKETKKAPTIRFRGFTDDWEQRKLSEYLVTSTDKNHAGRFSRADVLSVSGELGIINQIEFQGRSFAGASVLNYGIVKTNDIVYTKSPLKVNPYGIIKANAGKSGIVSTLYAIYHPKKNTDSKFIECYFDSNDRLNHYLRPLVNKGAKNDMKVTNKDVLKGKVDFPPTMKEQRIIVSFITEIEMTTALYQRKLDQLKKLKKYFLQNMFPAKGEKVPRIRFKGFTGDWEQSELEELATFSKGIGYSKSDLLDSGKPIILYGRLYTKYETVITNTDTFVDEKDGSVHSLGGEVIVPASGETAEDISIASVVKKSGIIIGGDLNIIHPSNNIDSTFLAISISNGEPHKDMARRAQGKSVVHLHNDDLSKIKLWYPSLEEQRRIGQYFCNIDSLINLNQHKINELQTLKKYMIQNMFI